MSDGTDKNKQALEWVNAFEKVFDDSDRDDLRCAFKTIRAALRPKPVDIKSNELFLWELLGDIDTVSDQVKDNNVAYREMVEKIQKRRFEISDSDGYTVTFKTQTQPKPNGDDRGKFHNAFWEAYKILPEPIRKKYSLHIGRTFANTMFDKYTGKTK